MSWGWDTSPANGYYEADGPISDKKLIETLNQAGSWHCGEAAKRLRMRINQADTDHAKIEMLKQDVINATDPEFMVRLESEYQAQITRLSNALQSAMNEINALKDALAQAPGKGFEP
jgi:hypothetical protein